MQQLIISLFAFAFQVRDTMGENSQGLAWAMFQNEIVEKKSTDNDVYSGDVYSGNDGYSGPKPPDDAILFAVSGITAITDKKSFNFHQFLAISSGKTKFSMASCSSYIDFDLFFFSIFVSQSKQVERKSIPETDGQFWKQDLSCPISAVGMKQYSFGGQCLTRVMLQEQSSWQEGKIAKDRMGPYIKDELFWPQDKLSGQIFVLRTK